MDLLDDLNENQKKAVLCTEGPLLILAGAGSGKTRVIIYRIAHLIGQRITTPFGIFAVTFTNKAAEEMQKRIVKLIGPAGSSVFIRTFHSAAVYILRRYGDRIGIPKSFSIFDQSDQESVIRDVLLEMRLDPKSVRPSTLSSKISAIKNSAEILDGGNIDTLMPKYHAYNFTEIYTRYHEILRKQNALDFDDLLIKTVELLRKNDDSLIELQRRWRYIMVDEYQDTNYAQYLISKLLASSSKNICVVGDDDQSIYSWRGADIRNILNFEKDYANATVIVLEENYRSTSQILDAASTVIKKNVNRKEKNIRAFRGEGEPVVWCRSDSDYSEAEFAINSIIKLKGREGLTNNDFAVFYRTNAQSRIFEEVLRKENINYRVVGGLRFYDRKEVKDIIAYLRFISNPFDEISLVRIINTPARGIGRVTVEKIKDQADSKSISMWEIINGNIESCLKLPRGAADFRDIIRNLTTLTSDIPRKIKLSQFIEKLLDDSGYIKALGEEKTDESRSRLENIEEFVNSVYEYEESKPDSALDEFIQDISLLTSCITRKVSNSPWFFSLASRKRYSLISIPATRKRA
jgi:DNA helicase-2/ATP-dependent DNA helicase PcrA